MKLPHLLKGLAVFFVFVAVLFCGLRIYSDRQVAEVQRRYPPEGSFVTAEGLRLHYVRRGEGRPIVFIHGSFGSVNDFTMSVFPRAAERFDAIAFDRPGHGYSERPWQTSMTIFDHARLLHEAVKALGVEKPVIIGHSLGGAVALAYALDYPEDISALLLLSGYVTPYDGPPRIIHRVPAWPILGSIYLKTLVEPLGMVIQKGISRRVFSSGAVPREYLETAGALARRPLNFKANAEDIRNLPAGLKRANERLNEIKKPVILLTGDADVIAPKERHAERFHSAVPSSELMVLPGIGHQPSFAAPDKVLEAIDLAWRKAEENAELTPKEPVSNLPESPELPER